MTAPLKKKTEESQAEKTWAGAERRKQCLRRREDRLREKEKIFLHSVINGVTDPIVVVGTDFRIKLINQAALTFAGHPQLSSDEQPHCYRTLYGLGVPCDLHGKPCPLVDVLETGKSIAVEHEHSGPDGETRVFELLASPLQSDDGSFLGIIEIMRDITERKAAADLLRKDHKELEGRVAARTEDLEAMNAILRQEIEDRRWAEDELLQAKEQAELLYRVVPSAIFTVDLQQRITSWNNKAQELTGYKREEVLGQRCEVFALKPCTRGCGLLHPRVKKPIVGRECEIRTKAGEVRIISKNADLLRDTSGQVIGGIESFEDITDRKATENVLRTERDKFRSMLSALGQGMHILNRDYRIEYQNEVLRSDFGDKIGHRCYQVYRGLDEPCEICRMLEAIHSGEIQRTEVLMSNDRYYEQSYAPFRDVDGETKVLILLRDITEAKALQAETMRAGQLAAIGELAAGVAHEINNPINGIINYAQVILDNEEVKSGGEEILTRIIREGERISAIVRNLLSFARQDGEELENVALEQVLHDSLDLVNHQFLKDGIQVASNIAAGLPPVRANVQQLQQVFLNLLSNARFALNQRYPGRDEEKRLEIRSELVKIEKRPYIRVAVTDYGTGIPDEIVDHIFKPFFSMKKPGEGTGLGLSISHGLVKDFNGFLWVDSKLGQYTTMTVDLPAVAPK